VELPVYSHQSLDWVARILKQAAVHGKSILTYAYWVVLIAGMAIAQDNSSQHPLARQQLQHIHGRQSIDQALARLTKDLKLTPERQKQVRPLLQEHHDRIQALLDKNPTASRQELASQIHSISDETHHKIRALLTDPEKELERRCSNANTMVQENRRPAPPAAASPEPPSSVREN
jgi:hypothetical protein